MANKNILKNTKLIIGQHGIGFPLENNSSIMGVPRSEINFSDYYLLWGNSIEDKDKGFFNSTIISKRKYLKDFYKSNVNKSIIQLIQPNIEFQYKLFNTKSYYINFFKDFDRFLNIIDKKITQNIFIKIHSSDLTNSIKKNIWHEKILHKKSISSNIDKNFSKNKIAIINKKTRIFVFNYFSTGFLECMSENIPCIIYCPSFENYFDNKLLDIIKSLIDYNILFDNYHNMNNFLNKNFNNIDKWWYSENLQKIRINFCYKFAQKHDSSHIFDILKEINEK
jgi:putative transferase (TIGR04331 family)